MEPAAGFDAIVIGSGMGGLTTAAILARLKKLRVLVLERHFRAGGFTHTFKRPGGYEWDVGLHYVGEMRENSRTRMLMDYVTGGIRWNRMPFIFDRFVYPGLAFDVPTGEANYRRALSERFPAEAHAIKRYFEDIHKAVGFFTRKFVAAALPGFMAAAVNLLNGLTARLPLMTTREYFDGHFRDPELKAVLASQWMDYGLPPSQSAFVTHAVIVNHYLAGAWYPEGGAGTIAEGARRIIENAGGKVLVNHAVERVIVEHGRAAGVEVRLKNEAELLRFSAPLIVSDCGAWNTFQKLVAQSVDIPFRNELDELISDGPSGCTLATLYLGLDRDPRTMGFQGENYWLFEGLDHEAMLTDQDDLVKGKPHGCYLSFPSLKDKTKTHHTAEIIAPLSYACVQEFRHEPWRRRSERYRQMKETISRSMLEAVERRYPGFSNMVVFSELSTPLTVEHFTAHPRGAVYGIPGSPARYRQAWLKPKTPVKGLYLTGADAGSLGIVGALMAGVTAAAQIIGPFGFISIVAAATRSNAKARVAATAALQPTT
jgi:all-trans-retinol 13,14-reductase